MKNYKDKIYKNYLKNREVNKIPISIDNFNSRKPFYLNLIAKYFFKDKTIDIVDLGCGSGGFLHFMKSSGYNNIKGIDLSEDSLNAAKKLGINGIVQSDIFEFLESERPETYDLITAIDLIEHLSKKEIFRFGKLVHRILKSDGKLILHQPNAEGIFGGGVLYGDFTHETAFTRKSINQIFKTMGYSKVLCVEDKPICYNIKGLLRRILWSFFVRPFYSFLLAVESGGLDKNAIFTQNFVAVITK